MRKSSLGVQIPLNFFTSRRPATGPKRTNSVKLKSQSTLQINCTAMCPSQSYSALMHGFCACLLRLPLQSLLTPENCKAQAVNKVFQLFLLHFLFNDIRASLPTCFEHKKRSSHSYSCIFLYLTILPLDTQRRGFP